MLLGWDTCRPSSPSNGAAQESRLNTTGDRQASTIMAASASTRLQKHFQYDIEAMFYYSFVASQL